MFALKTGQSGEAGGPRLHVTTWRGIWAPKGTPRDVITRINRAVTAALADPNLQRRAADLGQQIVSRDQQTPQALAAHHRCPHGLEHRVDGQLGLHLGDVGQLRNLVHDVDFDHVRGATSL